MGLCIGLSDGCADAVTSRHCFRVGGGIAVSFGGQVAAGAAGIRLKVKVKVRRLERDVRLGS